MIFYTCKIYLNHDWYCDFSKLMKHEFAETDMTDSIGYMNLNVLLKRHMRCSISSFVAYGVWVSLIIDSLYISFICNVIVAV